MKKQLVASLVLLASSPVFAAFNGPHSLVIDTVAAAQSAQDDTVVELKGYIIKALGHETYLFKDSTGEINVEIDHEDWRGVDVSPVEQVIIRGEVDNEWTTTQIDVDSVQKI
ncbi:protein YgiW precursor [Photobacterium aquae]|uniref:Protein YgiW n=1 Tax=Photobacterium aquae TaxID=1195763 RepID=A0A0J1HD88_9GAMM|nr:NirD/YgiW/YdeI family stress tolerance protein [Photobacterium aquae]KLV09601.1 protein YgiW precursor [Photobacterium aquae]